jgi:hypothetical protein
VERFFDVNPISARRRYIVFKKGIDAAGDEDLTLPRRVCETLRASREISRLRKSSVNLLRTL